MREKRYIIVNSNWRKIKLDVDSILYIRMRREHADIHLKGDRVCVTRTPYQELKSRLGEGFVEVRRGTLVSVIAIHDLTETINLNDGHTVEYTIRRKKEIEANLYQERKKIINHFSKEGVPTTRRDYCEHYRAFEHIPFAFADIEMIFDEECHAVDWLFRYGNEALAKLEKIPLDELIGNTFGSLFENMDSKWLKGYERAALYGETLEIMDYSPEIDTYLKVICFPTFEGHCGCILFDIDHIDFIKSSDDTERALMLYFDRYLEVNEE